MQTGNPPALKDSRWDLSLRHILFVHLEQAVLLCTALYRADTVLADTIERTFKTALVRSNRLSSLSY